MKALAIILLVVIGGYFFLMSHTQIIVGAVQKLSQNTVNTKTCSARSATRQRA